MQAKVKGDASQSLVVTASRLRDGRVVWLADGGAWTEQPRAAQMFVGAAIDAPLSAAIEQMRVVVDVYAVAVTPGVDGPWPLSVRERIRAAGPSVVAGIAA